MKIEENKSLKEYNTFGIDCKARFFVSVGNVEELIEVITLKLHATLFILGGGSNMLLTQDIDALVIHINLKGIKLLSENDNSVQLEVMAGENWHEFVQYCLRNDYGGVENLSLIPGNVGTAPMQNIGAYGVELKDVFVSCKALEIKTKTIREFSKTDCEFGYRSSVFKTAEKGNYFITSVLFELSKQPHNKQVSYGAIQEELSVKNIVNPTIQNISEVIIAIRQSKLPDPKELGNSGSFFKNPVIDTIVFNNFRKQNPEAPFYKISNSEIKIPAGWLIEKAGFKGKRYGDAGVHKNQALVLVNYGNATGSELWELAMHIQKEVQHLFGITLEPEVNVI